MSVERTQIPTLYNEGVMTRVDTTKTSRSGGQTTSRVYEVDHLTEDYGQLPSVTSVIGDNLRNFGIEIWAKQWIERGLEEAIDQPMTQRRADEILRASSQEADQSAQIGTDLHDYIEKMLAGKPLPLFATHGQLAPAIEGFRRWQERFRHWTLVGSEVGVWANHPLTAGTVAAVFQDTDGSLIVCAWKTSSGIFESSLIQVSAYAYAVYIMARNHYLYSGNADPANAPSSVRCMVVRFDNDYPRDDRGKKIRTEPKVFTDQVEYVEFDNQFSSQEMGNSDYVVHAVGQWFNAYKALRYIHQVKKERIKKVKLGSAVV